MDNLSHLLHMRRTAPMDDAVWLLEFLAKTGGAQHLRLSSRNLNVIQYLSLDVIAFIVALLLVLLKSLIFVSRLKFVIKSKTD